jgi:hypothetical protein
LSLEWHLTALLLLLLACFYRPLAGAAGVMELASLGLAIRLGSLAPLPRRAPWWCRPLVIYLYFMQPIWRGWHRLTHLLKTEPLPSIAAAAEPRKISTAVWDLYWDHSGGLGRSELLLAVVERARRLTWRGDYDNAWADWDVKLVGDRWHDLRIRTATEELGWPRRFTRARCTSHATRFSRLSVAILLLWTSLAVLTGTFWAQLLGLGMAIWVFVRIGASRRACLRAATQLCARAAMDAGLSPDPSSSRSDHGEGIERPPRTPRGAVDCKLNGVSTPARSAERNALDEKQLVSGDS